MSLRAAAAVHAPEPRRIAFITTDSATLPDIQLFLEPAFDVRLLDSWSRLAPLLSETTLDAVLLDIDTHGARQLRQRYPEAVSVFIMAPSMAELEARLRERNSNSPGDIARRLSRAKEEIAAWRQYDYLIINRDVKDAVDELATIIQAERCRTSRLTLRFPDMEVPA